MPQETSSDLSRLKLNRELAPVRSRRRRRWLWLAIVAVALAAGGGWYATQPRVVFDVVEVVK